MNLAGVEPNRECLRRLRTLFPCTGIVTRQEMRSMPVHWEAFERHRTEVLAALQDPAVARMAVQIILESARHSPQKSCQVILALWSGNLGPSRA
jgi:hypothetical protein